MFGCIDETDKKCNDAGGRCHPTLGICICNQYYTGAQCQTKTEQTVDIIDGQITDGRLAGIIIGWVLGVPICVGVVKITFFICRSISLFTSFAKMTKDNLNAK